MAGDQRERSELLKLRNLEEGTCETQTSLEWPLLCLDVILTVGITFWLETLTDWSSDL